MHAALRRFIRPTREERRASRGRDIWFVVLAAYALLAFAYFWPPDMETSAGAPVAWAAFMVRVLQFHIGLLVAFFAVIAIVRREWRPVLVAVPVIAFTIGTVAWSYVDRADARPHSGPATRLMTANLLVSNDEHDAMASEIKREKPDVLVLQEYSDAWHRDLNSSLHDLLPHSIHETRDDSFGTALYSRTELPTDDDSAHPILGSGETPQTRTVIQIDDQDVALFNIHLLPPIGMDYVREGQRQFDDLVDAIKNEKIPVIVVGDLNLTETTPQHHRLEKLGLRDAWDLTHGGRGTTWPNNSFLRYLPGLRLDHIYVSDDLAVVDVKIGTGRGSDHRPVIADVAMRDR